MEERLEEMMETTEKSLNCKISVENHRKLKTYAAKHGKQIQEIISEFVEGLE